MTFVILIKYRSNWWKLRKRTWFWAKTKKLSKVHCSDIQYAVFTYTNIYNIQILTSTKVHDGKDINTAYPMEPIRRIQRRSILILEYFNRRAYVIQTRYTVLEKFNTPYQPDFGDYKYKTLITNLKPLFSTKLDFRPIIRAKKVLQTQSFIGRTFCNLITSLNHSVSVSISLCFILYSIWLRLSILIINVF